MTAKEIAIFTPVAIVTCPIWLPMLLLLAGCYVAVALIELAFNR